MSCEAADGGGQTHSWNMDPDSEARGRSRCAGVGDVECGDKGVVMLYTFMRVRDDGDCESESE